MRPVPFDWEFVSLDISEKSTLEIAVEIVRSYSVDSAELSTHDWEDWLSRVEQEMGERFSLLITEREPAQSLKDQLTLEFGSVWARFEQPTLTTASRLL